MVLLGLEVLEERLVTYSRITSCNETKFDFKFLKVIKFTKCRCTHFLKLVIDSPFVNIVQYMQN